MILIIDNYDSFTYNLYQQVALLHSHVEVIRNDRTTVSEALAPEVAGIILSPGPGRPEDAGICIELIQALQGRHPTLGVCLGHQAIATAFGGNVVQAPQVVHGKHDFVRHSQEGIFRWLPSPLKVGRYHSLMVQRETLPSTLRVQAETRNGLIMGMRHKTLPLYGVQFHPESILTPLGGKILTNFIHICNHAE